MQCCAFEPLGHSIYVGVALTSTTHISIVPDQANSLMTAFLSRTVLHSHTRVSKLPTSQSEEALQ